ncbi:hypothetical protein NQZ68_042233, partial [Dissostichus eleginoides]
EALPTLQKGSYTNTLSSAAGRIQTWVLGTKLQGQDHSATCRHPPQRHSLASSTDPRGDIRVTTSR